MNTGKGLAFGVYDPVQGTITDGALSITIRCPKGLVPRALLSEGSAGRFVPRTMQNGTEKLEYNIYLDSSRTRVWGDGSPGTVFWDGPSGNSTLDAFGRIPASQDVAVGDYSDSLIVTVLF